MKKLLYICPHLSTGGMPQYVLKQSQEFEKSMIIKVVEVNNYSNEFTVQRKQFKNVIQLNSDESLLEKIVSDFNPDICYFQEIPETFLNVVTIRKFLIRRKILELKIWVTSHSSLTTDKDFNFLPDKIIAVNEWQKERFKNVPNTEIEIWEYPIEEKHPDKLLSRIALDIAHLKNYKKHILNVGLFTPGKNQGELFEIARQTPEYAYHFVGNQAENFRSYWEPLMKNKPDNCIIWGERSDVDLFYQMADEFYFTSKFELNPLVVKEALSWKLPVKMYKLETYGNFYDNNPLVEYLQNDQISKNYQLMKEVAIREIEEENIYERFFKINKGDIVVDVGAHVGIFTKKALNAGASRVLAIEPDPMFVKELTQIKSDKLQVFQLAIANKNGNSTITSDGNANEIGKGDVQISTITFEDFHEHQNLFKIDFLKIDCEGGEYDIFTPNNIKWISKNVKNITGEFHIHNTTHRTSLSFSLMLLRAAGFNIVITSVDGIIIPDIEKHLDYYTEVLFYASKEPLISTISQKIAINYNNGCSVEINSRDKDSFRVKMINDENNELLFESNITSGQWTKTFIEYFVKWRIQVDNLTKDEHYQENFNPCFGPVHITIDSKSIGDTLAWIPYVEEFRKKHNCKISCQTFHNYLFESTYPEITFVPSTPKDVYASYTIGWFYDKNGKIDKFKHPIDPRIQPLQKTACDILGLEYKEIKPLIPFKEEKKNNTVSLGIHSTAQAKYWNNSEGWQDVVNYINSIGKTPIIVSKESDGFMGNRYPDGVYCLPAKSTLFDAISTIRKSSVFIGIGSGLSWLAWACDVPVVLISGFSEDFTEMNDCIRISAPPNTCKGCFNKYKLNPNEWNWCPVHKGTEKQFECSKNITSATIIEKLQKLL